MAVAFQCSYMMACNGNIQIFHIYVAKFCNLKIGVLVAMIKFIIQKCDDITGRYAMVFLVAVR